VFKRLSTMLRRWATIRNILMMIGGLAILLLSVLPSAYGRISTMSGGVGPIDTEFAYTAQQAYERVAAYGPTARRYYAMLALSLDVIFPIVFALTLGLIAAHVWNQILGTTRVARAFTLLPFGGMAADLLENAFIATMLLGYPHEIPVVAWAASVCTILKWGLIALSSVIVATGLIMLAMRSLGSRRG